MPHSFFYIFNKKENNGRGFLMSRKSDCFSQDILCKLLVCKNRTATAFRGFDECVYFLYLFLSIENVAQICYYIINDIIKRRR